MDKNTVTEVVELCRRFGADYHIYAEDTVFGETLTNKTAYYDKLNRTLAEDCRIRLTISPDYPGFLERNAESLYKILIIPKTPEDKAELARNLSLNGKLSVLSSDSNLLDVMRNGINKGSGLCTAAEYMNLGPENIAAIGDQENDEDMLEFAGLGIAVANASDGAKSKAAIVTGKNNNSGAVAEAIDSILKFNADS